MAIPICRRLMTQVILLAEARANFSAGIISDAIIAIIEITTNNSIRVKQLKFLFFPMAVIYADVLSI